MARLLCELEPNRSVNEKSMDDPVLKTNIVPFTLTFDPEIKYSEGG